MPTLALVKLVAARITNAQTRATALFKSTQFLRPAMISPPAAAQKTPLSKSARFLRLAVPVAVVLMLSACGGDSSSSSGLATLADVTPTAAETGGTAQLEETAEPVGNASDQADTAQSSDTQSNTNQSAVATEEPAGVAPVATSLEGMSDEERLLVFAECMRENGVEFPDPVVNADGTVEFGLSIGRDPDMPQAREACDSLLQGVSFGPGRRGGFDETELQDALLEFARCMRENGFDIGDPDLRDFGPGNGDDSNRQPGGPFAEIRELMEDASGSDADEVSDAIETCREQSFLPGRGPRSPEPGTSGR